MSECTHNCSSCASNCSERTKPQDLREKPHELSKIKKVIAVVSGKGGVGKSMVTSLLSVSMQRKGYKTAIMDADITGPSIPKAFGIKEKASGRSWVTSATLFPSSANRLSVFKSACALRTSRDAVGSSRSKVSVSCASVMAM